MSTQRGRILLIVLASLAGADRSRASSSGAPATYSTLRDAALDLAATRSLTDLVLDRGPASIRLTSGLFIPFASVDGRETGGVFLGAGSFRFEPEGEVERLQVRRFHGQRSVDVPIATLVLRFSDATAQALVGVPAVADPHTVERARQLVVKSTQDALENLGENHPARLLVDLIEGRGDFFFARIGREAGSDLLFADDSSESDRYRLAARKGDGIELWSASGESAPERVLPVHYAIDAHLRGQEVVSIAVRLRLRAATPVRALTFSLSPLVELREVVGADGKELFFVREPTGGKRFEPRVTVVLPESVQETEIGFTLGGDLIDEFDGEFGLKTTEGWYPRLGYLERATFAARFRVKSKHRVFASGVLVKDEVVGDERVVAFTQERPVILFSFHYGDMRVAEVEAEGAPRVTVFGRELGTVTGDQLRNVGIDVANSLLFFAKMFGDYPFPYMYVTRIPFAHGQGFPGLLHLSAGTFGQERTGASEEFRGHETAHQWWGHVVAWKSYRDQWLSEGFANYSGLLYADFYLKDKGKNLAAGLERWRQDILFDKGESGPIALGLRLGGAYSNLVYAKGGYVLHMLRMLLYDYDARSDARFQAMMRDFVARHDFKAATTASFRAVAEAHVGADLGWFFDQWVYGTDVPTYRWAWTVARGEGAKSILKLRVRQTVPSAVPFQMMVPVFIDFGKGQHAVVRLPVKDSERVYDIPVPLVPVDVNFNLGGAVLAEVKKEKFQ